MLIMVLLYDRISTWNINEMNTASTLLSTTWSGARSGAKPCWVVPLPKTEALIEQKCADKGWEILELAMQPDHIHLFVRVWPTDSAADVVKECKGLTAHHLRQKYAVLKRLPSLWTRSYFASTAGNVSQDIIQHYLAAQKGM